MIIANLLVKFGTNLKIYIKLTRYTKIIKQLVIYYITKLQYFVGLCLTFEERKNMIPIFADFLTNIMNNRLFNYFGIFLTCIYIFKFQILLI